MGSIVNTRIYLRASTTEQDASRARARLEAFAEQRGYNVVRIEEENQSGTKLDRPKLMSLINDSKPGDILLIEAIDRLSRLKREDWAVLRSLIASKGVRLVSLDLPLTYSLDAIPDEFARGIMEGVTDLIINILANVAQKDYEDRRRRCAEGVAKAVKEGKYKGRPADEKKRTLILDGLRAGRGYNEVKALTNASNTLMQKMVKVYREEQGASK